jgi:TAG lipase/steryl ester hydrolase/phospholipase A2/LPA acyltransferase
VVRALLDANLLPRVVSGSSAGSLGAALLCTRTDAEVHELVADFPNTQGLDFFVSARILQPLRRASPGATTLLRQMLLCLPPTGCACPASTHAPLLPASLPQAHNRPADLVRHLLGSGYIQNHEFFGVRLRKLLGDLTFLDAYQRTGRILSIAVTAADTQEPSRLLNYLTAPNVFIWSAVACSSAFPFLFAPQDLLARDAFGNVVRFSETGAAQSQRRWCDGSLEEDLPMRGLSQLFGVNFFIASQSNPWLIGVVALKRLLSPSLGRLLESEFKHRCCQLLALWPHSRLLKMLCQPWEGDITVALPPTGKPLWPLHATAAAARTGIQCCAACCCTEEVSSLPRSKDPPPLSSRPAFPLGKAAINFTAGDIWQAMRFGQREVWKQLPAIRAACEIEVRIDELLKGLALQVRHQDRLERALAQASGAEGVGWR